MSHSLSQPMGDADQAPGSTGLEPRARSIRRCRQRALQLFPGWGARPKRRGGRGSGPASRCHSADDITRSPVLSQCTAVTTPGPPQGQLAAGSRRLIRELRCPQPLAVPRAREQPSSRLAQPRRARPPRLTEVWRHVPGSMDGAWVGTWRPHRPRGLISAQFPSPGPQYSIPGTTGFVGHSPTKARAPAYTFRGTKPPAAESCGPGPCYFVEPAITRNGKYVAPGAHLCGRPTTETTVTPGPSDYRTEAANRHVFKCPPVQSMAFRREPLRTDRPPGPGTYTLPRLMGPNTACTSASPCYSMRGRSQRGRFDEDLAKTPGPAALPKVAVDAYKTRAPAYTMAARPKPAEGKAAKPGPADYSVGRVTLIKPQAPASTFGIRHSLYTTPLIVE